jgi:uncharacterized protein (DUF2141 family)
MKRYQQLFIIMLLLISIIASAQEKNITLKVSISNISPKQSEIYVALYNNEKDFKRKTNAIDSLIVSAPENDSIVTFKKITSGTYAIAIFQDMNNNGKLDTKGFNIPLEPVGISNLTKEGKLSIPIFRKAKIEINSDTTVSIPLISSIYNKL